MKALGEMLASKLDLPKKGNEGLISAAEDILAAFKSGDPKALSEALSSHYGMYEGDEKGDGVPTGVGSY